MRLLFDVETDGLYQEATKLHCICVMDLDSGEEFKFYGKDRALEKGIYMLSSADELIGHNIINFDIPVLQKLFPSFDTKRVKITDTLIYSRLVFPSLKEDDISTNRVPAKFYGAHGLEAWGYRLGLHKGDYAKECKDQGIDPWESFNMKMLSYCIQDVRVTHKLYKCIMDQDIPEKAVKLEHNFAKIMSLQERHGFAFDEEGAIELYGMLKEEHYAITEQLKTTVKPWYVQVGEVFYPKRDNKTRGIHKDRPYCKIELNEFNPSSRSQIVDRLINVYEWRPKEFTEAKQPKVDETVLSGLDYPIAAPLARRFLLEKRLGQLAEGVQALMKVSRNGRIHGHVNTIGAVTGRCTHSKPNMAQIPSCTAEYGEEFRSLLTADEGWKLVGTDASGLELRCLAHYMAAYDEGAYGDILLNGDIHTANQKAAGLGTRNEAKTFIYAYLYGAGDAKIGSIVGGTAKEGKKLKAEFLKKTPALKKLKDKIQSRVEDKGYLLGIDGRKLHVRSSHAALNTLLQSAGALLVKQATVNFFLLMQKEGYTWGKDWAMVAHVHDEFQFTCKDDIADKSAELSRLAFKQAGEQYNWRCEIEGKSDIGGNWAETH